VTKSKSIQSEFARDSVAHHAHSVIAMIADNDIITARSANTGDAGPNLLPPSLSDSDTTERFKIKFVTAEHAVIHARQTPRERSEPVNGVIGFDGEFVSGNTTLVRARFCVVLQF
jgi:hypothetical protein